MTNWRHEHRSSFIAIHVRHLLCTVCFIRKTAGQKYSFQIRFQKNGQMVNLECPDLDLIRRIHPECGFYGFKIRFSIFPKKRKIFFLDSEIRIWMFPKDAPHAGCPMINLFGTSSA